MKRWKWQLAKAELPLLAKIKSSFSPVGTILPLGQGRLIKLD